MTVVTLSSMSVLISFWRVFQLIIYMSVLCETGLCAEPVFTMPLANLSVQIGKNATFTCHVRHIQGYKVGWVKADTKAIQAIGDHVITHNPRISVSHERQQKHKLHITQVMLEDEGPYMCQLNTAPMKYQHGFLEVYVPPDITNIRGNTDIVEGGSAILVCEASGHPAPKVYWQRVATGNSGKQRIPKITIYDKSTDRKRHVERVEGNVLELVHVKRSQMGDYLCIANNGKPPTRSRTVRINVKFRPVIQVPQQKVFGQLGKTVTIECYIESFPKGHHYWEGVEGNMISHSNSKYLTHEFIVNEYSTKSRLTIRNFEAGDVGSYKCTCSNIMNSNDRVEGIIYLTTEDEEDEYEEPYEDPDIQTSARPEIVATERTTYHEVYNTLYPERPYDRTRTPWSEQPPPRPYNGDRSSAYRLSSSLLLVVLGWLSVISPL